MELAAEQSPDIEMYLRGFRHLLRDSTGIDLPVNYETRIDLHLEELGDWDDISLLDLSFRIEAWFHYFVTTEDWEQLSGADLKYFTFGRLADLIAGQVDALRVRPDVVLGKPCLTAGAFRSIQRAIAQQGGRKIRFGPSTRIDEVLRGFGLRRFWKTMRWLSDVRVPPLMEFSWSRTDRVAHLAAGGVLIVLLISILAEFSSVLLDIMVHPVLLLLSILGAIAFSAVVLAAMMIVGRTIGFILNRVTRVLPDGVETFGDLARLVAGENRGYCESCRYNLTGVVSERCPECGSLIEAARRASAQVPA